MNIIVFYLNFLTAERYFILGVAKLNQHIYFKGILISKFESKVRDFKKKKGSAFVSTKSKNLWITHKDLPKV